jgi:hypothetical protein
MLLLGSVGTGVRKARHGEASVGHQQAPAPHLAKGAANWEEFGFNSLAVEAAEWHGKVLTLVLSASDLAAARPGQVPQDVGTKPSQVVIVQSRSGVGTNAAELVDCGAPMHESGGRGIGGLSL